MNETRHHWLKISKEVTADYPVLSGELTTDYVVIGGGLSGLNAAIELIRLGASVVVLEQDRIGQAASGRNNGQVIPHHSKASPREMEQWLGAARGERYNGLVASAPAKLFELIDHYDIRCDSVRNGWMQACHSRQALDRGRTFYEQWKAFGARVEWLDRDALAARMGSVMYPGGWKALHAGHLNPYALCCGLARGAVSDGVRLYENSPATAIVRDGSRWRVRTPAGDVSAKGVLVMTNALTGDFWPGLRRALIPVRIYQVATEPLNEAQRRTVLPGNEGVSDTRKDLFACRYDSEGRLEAIGAHTLWHDAAARGQAAVMAKFRAVFPQLAGLKSAEYWEGTLAAVPDRIPRLMRLAPNLLFAGVYSGRGVAMSTVWGPCAARLLAGAATEADMPVPVTPLRQIHSHGVAVRMAGLIHPWHRLTDKVEAAFAGR
ncbi:Putative FAD dependent oxidoreductase [Paraburkholderia unamae]|uniref:NAD(P)/FAD-dependent oxidoreductase n=1 Tax=Paraburkholderia unamae TaxID=219649 RepID=UPI001CB11089|nr:FAD-binding oxidoreductase [Paraburkholderia unamae]CAG9269365.1 Putative FAD dependent oxidoreductase [Paraburkholderia unamae]